jgi:hypothetical protein
MKGPGAQLLLDQTVRVFVVFQQIDGVCRGDCVQGWRQILGLHSLLGCLNLLDYNSFVTRHDAVEGGDHTITAGASSRKSSGIMASYASGQHPAIRSRILLSKGCSELIRSTDTPAS